MFPQGTRQGSVPSDRVTTPRASSTVATTVSATPILPAVSMRSSRRSSTPESSGFDATATPPAITCEAGSFFEAGRDRELAHSTTCARTASAKTMPANITARSLKAAKSAVLIRPSPLFLTGRPARRGTRPSIDHAGRHHSQGQRLHLVRQALRVAGAVEAGHLDVRPAVATRDPHPGASPPDEERAHETDQRQSDTGQRDPLAGAVADLQLDPALPSVEPHRTSTAGQVRGVTR